jgi:hypothetical protein
MSVDVERAQESNPVKSFPGLGDESTTDERSSEQQKQDAKLADRLSGIIEDANRKVVPHCKTMRQVSYSFDEHELYVDPVHHSTSNDRNLSRMTRKMSRSS